MRETTQQLEDRRRRRERQYARRRVSGAWLTDRAVQQAATTNIHRGFIRPPRPARCGWPLGRTSIRLNDGYAYIAGVERCASPWCCPVCTPTIRARRAQDLRDSINNWTRTPGHALVFATFTVPHGKEDPLEQLIRIVSKSWSLMAASQQWRRLKQSTGIRHYARAMEVTWNPANGWHAHLHALLYLDQDTDPKRLQRELHALWANAVGQTDPERKRPSKRRGVKIEPVTGNPTSIADYMTKTPDRRDIASELTRGDSKRGRKTSINPLQLLDPETGAAIGRDTAQQLWCEYVDATKRKRSITWSRHLRAETLPHTREQTDREIIDQTLNGIEAIPLTHHDYRQLNRNPSILGHVLAKTETGEIPLALDLINAVTGDPAHIAEQDKA